MTWVGPLLIVIGTVAAMEAVAWAVHKYIMHGWGLSLIPLLRCRQTFPGTSGLVADPL